ncbi:hypothetical protein [Parendozoicomonas haliclonae]|uniref:hypothetical protein n=1 Tax=Parendozoicomonas haliclonae TaxID=1960125 RepID=UPI001054EDFE|nr:hypothetical protein [Parendozoicomonas haliclonae]
MLLKVNLCALFATAMGMVWTLVDMVFSGCTMFAGIAIASLPLAVWFCAAQGELVRKLNKILADIFQGILICYRGPAVTASSIRNLTITRLADTMGNIKTLGGCGRYAFFTNIAYQWCPFDNLPGAALNNNGVFRRCHSVRLGRCGLLTL